MPFINLPRSSFVLFFLLSWVGVSIAQDCDSLKISSISNPGPYKVKKILEKDGLRDGPDYYGATLYYPEDATPPFASIVIVPGFWSYEPSIQAWGPFLASHGIVTMTIGTNILSDFPEQRALALLDAAETIKQENIRESSPLYGSLDPTRIAVSGWSMGGGGAQMAAVLDTTLKAVMALAPWQNTQLTETAFNHPVPTLIFSGEKDPTAPASMHATAHYNYTPQATSKLLFEVKNGNHSVANTPEGGNGDVGRIAIAWLKNFLVGQPCYCPLLLDPPVSASKYVTNVQCSSIASVSRPDGKDDFSPQIFPNPVTSSLTIGGKFSGDVQYEIISLYGQVLRRGIINAEGRTINVLDLTSNIYILRLGNKSFKFVKI